MKSTRLALACAFAVCFAPSSFLRGENFRESYGQLFQRTNNPPLTLAPNPSADYVRRWNQIAINANGLDHTPVAPGEDRVFGEQLGPGRSSRAMAIVHIAIADAVAVSRGEFTSYTGLQPRTHAVSMDTAIAQAAHDTLAALYPSQAASFDSLLVADLHAIHDGSLAKAHGRNVGHLTAATVLALRHDDGSQVPEPRVGIEHITSNLAGHWRQDPISLVPLALGAKWGECTPFVLDTTSQFRVPPPPSMKSAKYAAAYHEAKRLGGDGITTPTQRTPDQTFVGIFWAYDGTPSLCAPPRMYNQIAVQVADQTNLNAVQLARLLALVNVAMADTGMSVWESKYHWDFWRPITGIRESDVGTGPTGTGDRNPHTHGDSNFVPLGAPASNLTGPNFTPPFPAYPSGHAAFGGAVFEVLRRFYGTDQLGFTFVSDEFNGTTAGNNGVPRAYIPRTFATLSQAEEENGQSRIYLGIHWSFDKTEGIKQGRSVADYVYDRIYTAP